VAEYEIADLTTSVMSNYIAAFAIFITIISAYIVVAFVAGAQLSRGQVAFVNLCFLAATVQLSFLCAVMLSRAFGLNVKSPLAEIGGPKWSPAAAYFLTCISHAALVLGCIWFMHRVRNRHE